MSEEAESPVPAAESASPLGARLGKRRGRRLHSITNVKACLADVIRQLEADRMDTGKARALVYALSTMASILQAHDFEQRLAALERHGHDA